MRGGGNACQPLEQLLTPAVTPREVVLHVVAGNLVLERRHTAGEEPDLGHGPELRQHHDPGDIHPEAGERLEQARARFVVAHHTGRQHGGAEGGQVGESVRAAPRDVALPFVAQDDHRRLAGDALGGAEHEPVQHQVAVEHDAARREPLDQLVEMGSRAHACDSSPEAN